MTTHLDSRHRHELEVGSAIAPERIEERGAVSIDNPRALPDAFTGPQRTLSGLLFPIHDVTGTVSAWQLKPDNPRLHPDTGKPIKYETAIGSRPSIDVPPSVRPMLRMPDVPLWITEGCKKVDSALSNGIACIVGLLGVWNWKSGGAALPDFDEIVLRDRRVNIAFDSDVMRKEGPRAAIEALARFLEMRGADVRFVVMPDLPGGEKCGLDDWFAAGGTVLQLENHTVEALPGSELDWDTPAPLDSTTGPPFPVEALPGTIGELVLAVAEETQTPPDLAALVALGSLSAAAGGKYVAYVPSSNWSEPVHVMVIPVAEPGNRKSGVFRRITGPIGEWERERNQRESPALAQWESRLRVLEKQLAAAENEQGKPAKDGKIGVSDAQRMAAVDALQEHQTSRPVMTEVTTDDATPEAVKSTLIAQNGALAVMSAESAFLSNVAGRYSNAPHLDTILNGHAGDEIKVSRKGKLTERTERACLTLCLMVQPQVIKDLGQIDGFRTRGAAARLLPAFPADFIGSRSVVTAAVPLDLLEEWRSTLRAILDVPRTGDPRTLNLSPEALAAFDSYRSQLEPLLKSEGPQMQGWLAKLAGAVLRIAGLLHIAAWERPENEAIEAETIRRAIAIGTYFHHHARIMFRLMYSRDGQSEAASILDVLRTIEGESITTRNLWQRVKNRSGFDRADMDAALDVLEESGWIRRERQSRGTGRPSEIVLLNPAIKSQKSRNTPTMPGTDGYSLFETQYQSPDNLRSIIRAGDLGPTGTDGVVYRPDGTVVF
jgi:replicative DNA helicase